MKSIARKEVRTAIARAKEMLARNTDPCETFEGVLSRGYVRALRTLVTLGEKYIAKGRAASKRVN